MKRFYLALKREKLQKSIYPLEGAVSIGRSPENDITLVDYNVSRTHARVSFQNGFWVIEDLGSANGVIFAGERVVSKTLNLGDTFQIGESLLIFMEEGAADKTEQLSAIMQVFSSLINYQSPLSESETRSVRRFSYLYHSQRINVRIHLHQPDERSNRLKSNKLKIWYNSEIHPQ